MRNLPPVWKKLPLKTRILSLFGIAYIHLVALTSRIVWVNRSVRDELEANKDGYIYAFWHGRQVFLVYLHRHNRVHPLVSRSKDGELISTICSAFGLFCVRGSSSRGGSEALLELKSLLEKGDRIAFTPDGPRGPLRQIQPGVLFIAQKTGRPIVPIAYGARRRWVFKKSWDEFIVPKPLNHIAMVYGEPITVGETDDLKKKEDELRLALNRVANEADTIAGLNRCN